MKMKIVRIQGERNPFGFSRLEVHPVESFQLERRPGKGKAFSRDVKLGNLRALPFSRIGQVEACLNRLAGLNGGGGKGEFFVFEGGVAQPISKRILRTLGGIEVIEYFCAALLAVMSGDMAHRPWPAQG